MRIGNKSKYKIVIITALIILLIHSLIGSISVKQLLNFRAIEIIIAGVLFTVIIAFSFDTLIFTYHIIKRSFKYEEDYEGEIYKIYNYAIRVKKYGALKLQSSIDTEENKFVKDGIQLICDYVKPEDIQDVLTKDIQAKKENLYRAYNLLKMVAQVSPAFGLVGTLIGMVGVLSNIDNPQMIAINMSSALVSTLYGALISNFIAIPLMGRVKEMIDKDILKYRIIKEGIYLIGKNDTTRNVFDKMNAMLPDEKRVESPVRRITNEGNNIYE